MDMDPYTTLGVNQSASDQDIKKAFKDLAKKYHPDRGGDEAKFKEINEAYDKIKTADKRQQFEASKHFGGDGFRFDFGGDGFDPTNVQDIFNQFFGQGARTYRRQSPNKNIQINLEVSLEDVYTGITKRIHIDQTGKDIDIKIPRGIAHGQSIRYNGLGMSTNRNMPTGDLMCRIYIANHPLFVRDGLNLYAEKSISVWNAINGTTIQMPTIDGKNISIKIPPGTQPGNVMKIPQHGMINTSGRYGDYFVKINVSIPKNLTKEDRDDIQRISQKYS
jgi:curved DNA-binding protein